MKKTLLATTFLTAALVVNANAQTDDIDTLMGMSLKELTKIEVTSVSKKSEKASEAPAAIYVLTQDDIKRTGANSIPEALRVVPGLHVSRIDSHKWAVGVRGLSADFSNKLLVLIDGRSVYNPLFSGVLWEEQSTPLEDVERIEVIRGPGATLWGANAVNGIINVITKSANDTTGTIATLGGGNFERGYAYARSGGKIDEDTNVRAYAQYTDNGHSRKKPSATVTNGDREDDWTMQRVGFRADGKNNSDDFTLQGDAYVGQRDEPFEELPVSGAALTQADQDTHHMKGANIIGKYSYAYSPDSKADLQMYYDYSSRKFDILEYEIHTFDLDFQNTINLDERNEFIWGVGYRAVHDLFNDSNFVRLTRDEESQTTNLFSGFIQDKYAVIPNELYLTVGSKIEHNTYTGVEIQPNARFTWLPDEDQTVWGAVTRAVRTPSQSERTFTQIIATVNNPGLGYPFQAAEFDNKFDSEDVISYELGYRIQPQDNLSLDATAFLSQYDNLRTTEVAIGPLTGDILVHLSPRNKAEALSKGFELSAKWDPTSDWNLTGSYSYIDLDVNLDASSTDSTGLTANLEKEVPNQMVNLLSTYKLFDGLMMDNNFYYVDDLKAYSIKNYLRFDTQLRYEAAEGIDVALIGQNLLDTQHQEFRASRYNRVSEIPRSVFGKVTLRF